MSVTVGAKLVGVTELKIQNLIGDPPVSQEQVVHMLSLELVGAGSYTPRMEIPMLDATQWDQYCMIGATYQVTIAPT